MILMDKDNVMKVKMIFEGILLPLVGLFGLAGKICFPLPGLFWVCRQILLPKVGLFDLVCKFCYLWWDFLG